MITLATLTILLAMPATPPKQPITPVPGYDWMAPSKRKGEPAPPPVPPEQVVDDFMTFISTAPQYAPEARAFVEQQRKTLAAEDLGEFINLSYAVLSPEFKQGVALMDDDNPAAAADVLEKVAASEDPFLAVAAANLAATALIDLDLVDRCEEMLNGVLSRHKPIEKYTTASDYFRFMLGYCQVHNLEYELAYGTFEDFLKNHPNAPERLRTTAAQIMTELSRRAPGQLGDVRDLLTYARRKLKTGNTDAQLLNRQDEAVALLEALIDDAEQQEQNQKENQQGQQQRNGRGRSQGQSPGSGATESTLPTGGANAPNLRKTVAKPGEMWGKMPPREREQVLQTLQKQFPSQYRELLEQYYKQLSKDAPTP